MEKPELGKQPLQIQGNGKRVGKGAEKMNELKQISKLVKQILIEDTLARNSDMFLYLKVCQRLNPSALTQPFWAVVSALKHHNLPPFETVRRSRQKIQAKHPELAGTDEVEAVRSYKEDEFREFARG